MDPSSTVRPIALLAVTTVALLLILLGLGSVVAPQSMPQVSSAPGQTAPATITPSAVQPPGSASPTIDRTPGTSPSLGSVPSTSGDPILVGAGDIAECDGDGDEATARLLEQVPGTVFTAGDNVYPAASEETLRDCFGPSWGRVLERMRPVAGNHDWARGGIDAYRAYFADRLPSDGRTWYAYDLGSWRVIVLDSDCEAVGGCGPDSAQGRWLADELATNPTRCTVAIWHHPRFSSGERHGDDLSVATFWSALYDAGAEVVINGHDHDYERFAPQDPDAVADPRHGIREFVVGTGGTELRGFADPRPNSELRASVTHGVLALTLRAGSYEWRFIPTEGDFADRGGAACH